MEAAEKTELHKNVLSHAVDVHTAVDKLHDDLAAGAPEAIDAFWKSIDASISALKAALAAKVGGTTSPAQPAAPVAVVQAAATPVVAAPIPAPTQPASA